MKENLSSKKTRPRSKVSIHFILFSILSSLVLAVSQNCSKNSKEVFNQPSTDIHNPLDFFQYSYLNKPNVYANLALVFPTTIDIGNFSQFQFYGILAPADGSNGLVDYMVKITDEADKSVCVGDSGILNNDRQVISFNCLGSSTLTRAKVTLTATYNGQQEIFESWFSK